MKLCCHKCKKTLTSDLRYVPVKYTKVGFLTRPSAGSVYDEGKVKKGLFYFTDKREAHSWTVFDMYGVSNKEELSFYDVKETERSYYRVIPKQVKQLVVGEGSILSGVIPEFKEGHGCCNYNMGHPLFCTCGVKLAEMYIDCFEDGSVCFYTDKIDRVYN